MSKTFLCTGGTTGCSLGFRPRPYCDRTPREATSSAKSSLPATPPTPRRQEPALRQAGRRVGGKMQAVGKVGTFLEATKTWAGWTTALPSSMCSLFLFPVHERLQMCWILLHFNNNFNRVSTSPPKHGCHAM